MRLLALLLLVLVLASCAPSLRGSFPEAQTGHAPQVERGSLPEELEVEVGRPGFPVPPRVVVPPRPRPVPPEDAPPIFGPPPFAEPPPPPVTCRVLELKRVRVIKCDGLPARVVRP